MTDPETIRMVMVPKDLLEAVLDDAEGDLWQTYGEFCISTDKDADGRHSCDKQQERIDTLRGLLTDGG